MSPWIPVALAVVLNGIALSERFYSRFVPDAEKQKHHLRQLAWWAFDVAILSSGALVIYLTVAHTKPPLSAARVAIISGCVSSLFFQGVLILGRRLNNVLFNVMSGMSSIHSRDSSDRREDMKMAFQFTKEFIAIHEAHLEVTETLAKFAVMPPEAQAHVRKNLKLLFGSLGTGKDKEQL